MTGILGQALTYAATGWPVFPCRPNDPSCRGGERCQCKAPMTPNGFKDATTDPEAIRAWWDKWPAANVAIATGAPAVDVLDVDIKDGGSGFEGFNRLKRTGYLRGAQALITTPSGGLHVYFAGTAQPSGRLPRRYLDFKASGGYVIAPPSAVHGKSYRLLDHRPGTAQLDWQAVRRLLDPQRPGSPGLPRNGSGTALVAWVAAQPEGNRNAGLYWAACRAAEKGLDPAELLPAAMAAGLTEPEARRTIASAARKAAAQ